MLPTVNLNDRIRIALRNSQLALVGKSILSKTESLRSLLKVYRFRFTRIISAYLLDKSVAIDNVVCEGRKSIAKMIWFSKRIARGLASRKGNVVYIDIAGDVYTFSFSQLLVDNEMQKQFDTLTMFKQMLKDLESLGGKCINRENDFLCEFRGLKYSVRKIILKTFVPGL